VHRDIKPANLLVDTRGTVKVLDMSLARFTDDAEASLTRVHDENVLGTADYLSPEQARGETLTASSDLYSLGVVMFEMLAGRPPFVGPTAVSIAMQHASANPPSLRQFNPTIPVAVEKIVMKTLEKEPVDRFQSAAEMQLALRLCAKELTRANLINRAAIKGADGRFPAAAQPGTFVGSDIQSSKRGQYSS